MSRLFQSAEYISSCSSDSDNGLSSDDDETESITQTKLTSSQSDDFSFGLRKLRIQNVIFKLYNREVCSKKKMIVF